MKVYQATLVLVKAAQFALNLVMSANPIGLVVLAIAALVAALVLAYKNSESFRNVINKLFSAIKTGVTASVDFIKGYLETVMGFYKSIFNGIAKLWNNTIGKLSFSVPDWVPGLGGKGFSVPNIPMLAEGGIVDQPGGMLAMIGEKGPEAVVPLDRYRGGGGDVTINVTGGIATSAEIGESVVNALRAYSRSAGPLQLQVA
jgi:gas vesicle protein